MIGNRAKEAVRRIGEIPEPLAAVCEVDLVEAMRLQIPDLGREDDSSNVTNSFRRFLIDRDGALAVDTLPLSDLDQLSVLPEVYLWRSPSEDFRVPGYGPQLHEYPQIFPTAITLSIGALGRLSAIDSITPGYLQDLTPREQRKIGKTLMNVTSLAAGFSVAFDEKGRAVYPQHRPEVQVPKHIDEYIALRPFVYKRIRRQIDGAIAAGTSEKAKPYPLGKTP